MQPDGGRRFVQPGATIRYLPQEPDLSGFATTLAYVEAGLASEADEDRHRSRYLLERLGLTGEEDPATLSGGEARRAALARVLAPSPDILLLDEPTNHLDLPGIEWLERELAGMRSGVVLISHDRRLLERISRATVWLDRGITRTLDRGFAGFEAWRDIVLEQEESERHKLGRKIAMEEDWLRYGVTARRKRNQKRLADLHALRKRRKEQRARQGTVRLEAAQADLSGRLVMVAEHVTKSFGDLVGGARFVHPHPARRPGRHRRPERRRQDDAAEPADRRAGAGCGRGAARHQPRAGGAGPAPGNAGPGADAGAGADRRARRHGGRWAARAGTSSAT